MALRTPIRHSTSKMTGAQHARRPLHRAYSALSVLFVIALASVVFVGVLQAAPSVTQYGIGWFLASGQAGTAYQPIGNDSPVQAPSGSDQIGFERQLYALINKARVERGFSPLRASEPLIRSAREHAKDMSNTQKFDVVDQRGQSPLLRAETAGFAQPQAVLELIGAGFQKPDVMVNNLLANPSAAANLLSSDINEVGVGYAFSRDGFHNYWTIDLGRKSGVSFTVVVNNGSESTTSPQVTLNMGGKGWAQQMEISNVPNFAGANWESYSETKSWALSDGTGPKKVYVKLRGPANQESAAVGEIAFASVTKGVKPGVHAEPAKRAPRPPNLRFPANEIGSTAPTGSSSTAALAAAPASALAPGYYQTSEFMLGKVTVGIVMPQCNGTIDKCTESWSSARMDQVYNQIVTAQSVL